MSSIIKNLTNKAKTEIIYPITVAEAVILNESTTLLNALDAKVDKALGKQLSQENYTTSEKSKLYSIENGAQINQNAFTKIAVIGSGDVVADQQQDTLNFVAGTNIVLSTAPNSDSVIISATGTVAIAASNTSIIDAADYYTSTDVEGALQEVGYTLAHISTEASNIPLQDVGEYYAVDNVEDALQQVGYTLANLSGQAIDISVVDIGNYYTSTNVEEVLQEVGLSLGTKAPINNPVFTGTVSGITNTMVGAAAASHTHNYAGSASAGGPANSTKASLTFTGNSTVVFDGSTAGTVAIPTSLSILQSVYPVGSIYISTVSTNPATLFGFGTWTAFAAGRTLIGVGTSDQVFAAGASGGASTHTLTETQIPSHNHSFPYNDLIRWVSPNGDRVLSSGNNVAGTGASAIVTGYTGGGGAHNNLQPYIVTYMWQRTA